MSGTRVSVDLEELDAAATRLVDRAETVESWAEAPAEVLADERGRLGLIGDVVAAAAAEDAARCAAEGADLSETDRARAQDLRGEVRAAYSGTDDDAASGIAAR